MPAKDGLMILERVGLKNVKIRREAGSSDQLTADKFLETIKKISEEKGYLPEQVFNAK